MCLVLNKSKWDYLKKQVSQKISDKEAIPSNEKTEYYKALDEQSKEWKKNWPDSVEGCVARAEARMKMQQERDLEFIRKFQKEERSKPSKHNEVVAEAKQKIFNTSCYGQQLISALRESKVVDERKAQIEMKKKIENEAKQYDELITAKINSMENNIYQQAFKKDEEAVRRRRQADIEHANINKMIYEYTKSEMAKAKNQERIGELEDARLQKINLDYEKHEMDHCKEKAIQEKKQYDEDQKAFREGKAQRERADDALVAVWAEYFDRVRCREKQTWEKIIKGRGESENYQKAYKMMEAALEKNKTNYERFVNKGIEDLEKRESNEANKTKNVKQHKNKEYFQLLREDYKTALEIKDLQKFCNSLFGEKQSLFTKSCQNTSQKVLGGDEKASYKPESFLAPHNPLRAKLSRRAQQPSPWNALRGQHEYFARQAAHTARECTHQHAHRKVVQEYKKNNNLDSAFLTASDF